MERSLPLLIAAIFHLFLANATHNIAGEIVYKHLGGVSPTYEITIITYTEIGAVDPDTLPLVIWYCGNNNSPFSSFNIARTQKIDNIVKPGIRRNEYKLDSYTFPGPGCFRLTMGDPNRISNIINIANPVTVPFYIEDTLIINDPQFFGYNNSPILTEHPIVFAPMYSKFVHNPGAFDVDGDSLTFDFIPPKADPIHDVPGYFYPGDPKFSTSPYPNNFTIGFNTGEIVWEVPTKPGNYNIAIFIREYRDGVFLGSMIRDMQIIVVDNLGNPPEIADFADTCIVAGQLLEKMVYATDPDLPPQTISMSATGGPFYVGSSPADSFTSPSVSPASLLFRWQTDCSHIRPGVYSVIFSAKDDTKDASGNNIPYSDTKTWLITVKAPAPENLQAFTFGNRIELTWDNPYECASYENFIGFSVWRKRGCDSLTLDTCGQIALKNLGYSRISGNLNTLQAYSFMDVNVSPGVGYSYRVLAGFATKVPPPSQQYYNQVSSLASNPVCAGIKSAIPLLTHTDVIITDAFGGKIEVKWVNPEPDMLDTLLNLPPYRLELFEGTGHTGTSNKVFDYTANAFSQLNVFSYSALNLNTLDNAYNYAIKFFATGSNGQFHEVGESQSASSIYLMTQAAGNQFTLTWNEVVPWVNYEYVVLRESLSIPGNYIILDTVTHKNYVDQTVINGIEYCYKIKGLGSYFNTVIPSPLINYSQKRCDVSIDTFPPCDPLLDVSNICDDEFQTISPDNLVNILTWTNPARQCGNLDIAGYKIYYAPAPNSPYELIATVTDLDDTVFTHKKLTSFAGCYVVTAIDALNNESSFNNQVCVDNCPLYELPNVFTPNNDGKNDFFTPIMPYYFVDRIDIKIYNKWGNLIFETDDPDINWDGTDQISDKEVAESVYFYVCHLYEIRVNGVKKLKDPLKGYIHLIRSIK